MQDSERVALLRAMQAFVSALPAQGPARPWRERQDVLRAAVHLVNAVLCFIESDTTRHGDVLDHVSSWLESGRALPCEYEDDPVKE